jgi:hypothetical protein
VPSIERIAAWLIIWWRREDSNLRPTDYETVALTT